MTPSGRSVLVVTVVHHPEDARIRHRQIASLLEAGWRVTYAAPFTGYGLDPAAASAAAPGLTCVDVDRARGRRRLAAQRSARRLLRRLGPAHDVVLLHDPELLPALLGTGGGMPPVVWDVHEDTAAALGVKAWVPRPARRVAQVAVRAMERLAERRMPLLLADHRYAERFRRVHPVVPNTAVVPASRVPAARPGPDGAQRVLYLGSITLERGAAELVAVGAALRERSRGLARLELIGPAHGAAEQLVTDADRSGDLVWHGFVPSDRARAHLDGALAGLSLLHDVPNFRPSMPTKVVEYLAHGIPVVTTPLPLAVDLVERSGAGIVVPFGDVSRTVDQLLAWAQDPESARAAGARGTDLVLAELDWSEHAPAFVATLARIADTGR